MSGEQEFVDAVAAIWRIPRPGPENLMADPRFERLAELCAVRYGGAKLSFSLSSALRSLGLPCGLPADRKVLALQPAEAARRLEASFSRPTTLRRYLCPLDFTDELPALAFGSAKVDRFTQEELAGLFDADRLARYYPNEPLDLQRLSQVRWLIVEETVAVDPRPEARAIPFMFSPMQRDFGAFEAHQAKYPKMVESALFFLLLAPWETWTTMDEVNWRGFSFPWIYSFDSDLALRPQRPPDAEALAFEWQPGADGFGERVEWEGPVVLSLIDDFGAELATYDDMRWRRLEAARQSVLMATPIEHFLVRAFAAEGIDEMMAHMTAIEAAVGEESDYRRRHRPKPDPFPNLTATERVSTRVAALLDDPRAFQDYADLFDLRSRFVHGRPGMGTISTAQKVMARSLARRVASAIVDAADPAPASRSEFLLDLLRRGAPTTPW